MPNLAVLSDDETAIYFRVSGIKNSFVVKSRQEAEEVFEKLFDDEKVSLIILTEEVNNWLQARMPQIRRGKDYPLTITIPSRKGERPKADVLAELIKRTVGVEIKVS